MTAISGDTGSGTTVGTGPSIGVEPHANWVQYSGTPNFTGTNMEDDSASATTCDCTSTGFNLNETTLASGSGDLFNMYTRGIRCPVSATTGNLPFVDIPYSNYKIYIYFGEDGDTGGANTVFSDGTTSYYYEPQNVDNFDSGTLTRVTSTDSGSPDTTGNYVLFEGLTASNTTITVTADNTNSQVDVVGWQIVEVTAGGDSTPYFRHQLHYLMR